MKGLHSQKGLSFYAIVFLLALAGFAAVCGMKIVPIYLDHSTLKNMVKQMDSNSGIDLTSHQEVRKAFYAGLQVNTLEMDKDEFSIYQNNVGNTVVVLDYERRVPLFEAIRLDVVVWFDEEIELTP